MEFILNNKKYSIINHELFINYLMVDSYFKDHSKYDYDISFDFLKPVLSKEKIEFEDIAEGAEVLADLIENGKVSFIASGVRIDSVGEAIPLLIALNSLLNAKPIVTLDQIEEELNYFLEKFRQYSDNSSQ